MYLTGDVDILLKFVKHLYIYFHGLHITCQLQRKMKMGKSEQTAYAPIKGLGFPLSCAFLEQVRLRGVPT